MSIPGSPALNCPLLLALLMGRHFQNELHVLLQKYQMEFTELRGQLAGGSPCWLLEKMQTLVDETGTDGCFSCSDSRTWSMMTTVPYVRRTASCSNATIVLELFTPPASTHRSKPHPEAPGTAPSARRRYDLPVLTGSKVFGFRCLACVSNSIDLFSLSRS